MSTNTAIPIAMAHDAVLKGKLNLQNIVYIRSDRTMIACKIVVKNGKRYTLTFTDNTVMRLNESDLVTVVAYFHL